MKKLFNARIPVLLALCLVAGVAAGYMFVYYGVSLFWIIAVIPVAAIAFILCAVFAKKPKILFVLPILAVFIIVGGVLCGIKLVNYSSKALNDGETYTFSATVCEKIEINKSERIVLKDVKANGNKVDGKIYAYLSDDYGEFCDVGYKVKFVAAVSCQDLFPYGELNNNVHDNVKYTVNISGGMISSYRFSLFGAIRSAVRDTLYNNTDGDTAAIAFAMLTGNTHGIEDSTMSTFRNGGIAHIFAVSGLHIGILYGILTFFFKKVRLNKYAAAAICLFAIIFYAGVCGFTLSSIRAVIMCAVSAISKLLNKKYDGLNSLALAVILILLIMPTSLFSTGFLLSVSAVGGIILLSKQIARPMKKLPRSISSAVGTSLGAQFGTVPAMLAGFGYLSGAGLLLNIVIVPVLSVIFEVLFVSVIFCTILPFAAPYIVPYAALPLQAVVSFLVGAGFEKALIKGFGAGMFALFYFICVLALSDKLNIKLLTRLAAFACSVCLLCSYTLWRTYSPINGYKIVASAYYGGGQVLIKGGGGNVLIITEGLQGGRIDNFLNNNYSANIDAVIILGGEDCLSSYYNFDLNCGRVYIYDGYADLQPRDGIEVRYESQFEFIGASFRFEDGYSIMVNCDGVDVAVCAGEVPFKSCDLLLSVEGISDCLNASSACFNGTGAEYNLYRSGTLKYSASDGNLQLYLPVRK